MRKKSKARRHLMKRRTCLVCKEPFNECTRGGYHGSGMHMMCKIAAETGGK